MKRGASQHRSSYLEMGGGLTDYLAHYAYDEMNRYGGLHCHDFYELYIHFRGAKYMCIDNKVCPFVQNQLLVLPPFIMHGFVGELEKPDYERAFLYVSPTQLNLAGGGAMDLNLFLQRRSSGGHFQYVLSQEDAQQCKQLLMRLEAEREDATPIGCYANFSTMTRFLEIVCRTVNDSNEEQAHLVINRTMQDVLSYINDHYAQPISLKELARNFGVSVSFLSHEFVKYAGRSVYDYILYRRVLSAKQMINTGVPFSEVAYHCGFGDYSNFLHAFKRISGMTPNAYRKMVNERLMTV